MIPQRTWTILMIGGASGVGKSTLIRQLANHFQLPLTEVDSFQVILERMTTLEQQPALHYWRTHPEAMSWTCADQLALQRMASRPMSATQRVDAGRAAVGHAVGTGAPSGGE